MPAQTSILRIIVDSKNAERQSQQLEKTLNSVDVAGDKASDSANVLSGSLKSLAVYMGGVVTVGSVISRMDMFSGIQNRLKLVVSSQNDLNKAMSDTFSIAQTSRQEWSAVATIYQRFSDNAKTLNINMEQTAKLTETVAKAVAISGASTQAADAALVQFGQALASGTLRGEELNSVMEQTPALAKAIAQGMGITVGELRSVAAEGKITSDVLVKALTKASASVDELFKKTDITIGQSFQLLTNEVTKFIGEAGKGTGAATALSESIRLLSTNLSVIADMAVVAGVGLITKTILTQTVAMKQSIAATIERRAADKALLQSNVQLAAAEVQRARQITALALTEVNLARQEFNSATTRNARAAATIRLTQAEIAHNIALKQSTASVMAQTVAENALNTTRTRGAAILGLVGGPVGALTLGVTALAAGYMLFSSKTEESTKSLRENNESVKDAIVKYNELDAVQKRAQSSAEKIKLNDLGQSYDDLSTKLITNALNLSRHNDLTSEQIKRVNSLIAEYKKTGDLDKFSQAISNMTSLTQKSKDGFNELAGNVSKAGNEYRTQRKFVDDISNSLNSNATAWDNAARGIINAKNALKEYTASLNTRLWNEQFKNRLMITHNKTQEEANLLLEAYTENQKKGYKGVTDEQKKAIAGIVSEQKALDSYNKAKQDSANASKKSAKDALSQQKKDASEAKRLAEQQFNTRESIYYEFANRELKIEKDLQKKIAEIRSANFSPKDTAGYIRNAENRAPLEKELYTAMLEEQLNEWQDTEEEKLQRKVYVNDLMIQLDYDMNDEFRKQAIASLKDSANYELEQIRFNKEKRIFAAEEFQYTEINRIKKRFELEREEISKNIKIGEDERRRLLDASHALQSMDESKVRDSAISDYRSVMGFEESPLIKQYKVLQKMRELDLINEEQYQRDKLMLQTRSMAAYAESMMGGLTKLVDENSKTYAVLFAAQKAFAVAQALINIPAAYSKAYDAVVGTPFIGPYIAPAVGAGAAAIQVAQAASIKSTNMQGFSSGGYTGAGAVHQFAGAVHKGEVVFSQNDIAKSGGVQAVENARINGIQSQASAPQQVSVNPQIVLLDERDSLDQYMLSPAGEKSIMKVLQRNGISR